MNKDLVKKVLELKREINRNSLKKLDALERCEIEGRIHGTMAFGGAQRTQRFTGRIFPLEPQYNQVRCGW